MFQMSECNFVDSVKLVVSGMLSKLSLFDLVPNAKALCLL